jgi:hypothetical protein
MKRWVVVLSCVFILYAGAVWALEGCLDFGADAHAAHHGDKSAHDPHSAGAGSHHSHTDTSKIHCPNVFGEFLISSRPSLSSDKNSIHHAAHDAQTIARLWKSVALAEDEGPPGLIQSKTFPLHLLLSVIRI